MRTSTLDPSVPGGELGKGVNGRVLAYVNATWPNAVMKEGVKAEVEAEAKLLHRLHHPNIVALYGKVDLQGVLFDGLLASLLALEPLDCTLQSLLFSYKVR